VLYLLVRGPVYTRVYILSSIMYPKKCGVRPCQSAINTFNALGIFLFLFK